MKKIMRGAVAAGAIAVTAAMTLSGCAPAPKTNTLTVWADKLETQALKGVAADFKKATGIKINLVLKDNPIDDFIKVGAKNGPDVILGAHDRIGGLVADGLIAPIDLGTHSKDFRDNAVRAFTYDSKLYGMPYTVENIALVCNAAKVPAQPTSWQQVADAGVQISLNAGGGDPYHMYALQTSFGSKVFKTDANGNYLPEVAMGTGGHEFANWLATDGATTFDTQSTWDSVVGKMKDGSKACWITGPWAQGAIDLRGSEYKIYSIPSVGGQQSVQFLGSRGFMISAGAKDALYAQKFVVDYVGTPAVQTEMFKISGRIPANNAAFTAAANDPIVKGFGDAGKNAEPMPAIPAMASVWASWGSTEVAIMDQKGDPATLWDKMIADITAAISK